MISRRGQRVGPLLSSKNCKPQYLSPTAATDNGRHISSLRFVSFLLRYAHDKSLDEAKVFAPGDIETMLFDQITKLAIQILKPEVTTDASHLPPHWSPSPGFISPQLGRVTGGADLYGPVPDSIEV